MTGGNSPGRPAASRGQPATRCNRHQRHRVPETRRALGEAGVDRVDDLAGLLDRIVVVLGDLGLCEGREEPRPGLRCHLRRSNVTATNTVRQTTPTAT